VRDIAGGVREWCSDETYHWDPERRPVRGGSWLTGPRLCRTPNRFGLVPWTDLSYFGFRLERAPAPRRGSPPPESPSQ